MVRAIVGGRPFDFSKEEIERRIKGVRPESIREHLVEILGIAYPPKQVLAAVTGWDRTSFTTMEAQRVLTRVGFACRRASEDDKAGRNWLGDEPGDGEAPSAADAEELHAWVARLDAALAVAQEAIASLATRVQKLEEETGHE